MPPEIYDNLCSASCSEFAPPERNFLLAEILLRERSHNNRAALAFIYNPTMAAAAALSNKDMEREELRKTLVKGHVGLSKPLLQHLNMPLLGNVEVKPLVVEKRDRNWTCCPPESVGRQYAHASGGNEVEKCFPIRSALISCLRSCGCPLYATRYGMLLLKSI